MGVAPECPRSDPWDQLAAREDLAALIDLPAWRGDVLALLAHGYGPTELAELCGIPIGTAANRIRLARERAAKILRIELAPKKRRRRKCRKCGFWYERALPHLCVDQDKG
jgi:DNA-directed RNA polymerase specialized sigma24 family protein